MARKESHVEKIARLTAKRFPSLSTSRKDVLQLVRYVLALRIKLARIEGQKIGNDARDIIYTSGLLIPLSDKALEEIKNFGRNEIHRRLRQKSYPFSRLDRKTREKLLRLPNSWIHEAANHLLRARRLKKESPQVRILAD